MSSKAPANARVATGNTIAGNGFSFNAPEGWTDAKDVLPSALAVAANRSDADGFSDNVNVIEDNTIVDVDRGDLEAGVRSSLEGVNARDIAFRKPIDVDGEEAVTVAAILEQDGTKYRTEQYAVDHGGVGYIITFSFSLSVPTDIRRKTALESLASWDWVAPRATPSAAPIETPPDAKSKPEPEPTIEDLPTPSRSQENAILAAQRYLDYSPFSESGLIDQLKYEGFSASDAAFGVSSLDADWKEQAAKSAERYLEYSPFSRSGLIAQLKYEGYSDAEATYGVDQTGL